MKLLNIFKRFSNEESGAVTVDWVVLTGGIVALGLLVASPMTTAIQGGITNVDAKLDTATK